MNPVCRIHDLPGDGVFAHPGQYKISRQAAKAAKKNRKEEKYVFQWAVAVSAGLRLRCQSWLTN
jgi:hypothetical protein